MGDIVPVCFTVDVSTFLPIITVVCACFCVSVIRTFPKHAFHLKDLDSFILHTLEDCTHRTLTPSPPPQRLAKTRKNHLNEEITPLVLG
jgi:hypothetical protein